MLDKKDLDEIRSIVRGEVDLEVAQLSKVMMGLEARLINVEQRLERIEKRLDSLEFEVRDIKRRLKDLESDTPTASEMRRLDTRVTKLEKAVGIN